jgi:hypothetical protein
LVTITDVRDRSSIWNDIPTEEQPYERDQSGSKMTSPHGLAQEHLLLVRASHRLLTEDRTNGIVVIILYLYQITLPESINHCTRFRTADRKRRHLCTNHFEPQMKIGRWCYVRNQSSNTRQVVQLLTSASQRPTQLRW